MKNVFEHIEHVKGKPHHVRRRVAVAGATVGSAMIALVWLVSSVMTGAFAIEGSTFALSTGQEGAFATTSASGTEGLAGAAAAVSGSSGKARIEIVDTTPPPVPSKQSDKTMLPF
jgi:hypothetical protein